LCNKTEENEMEMACSMHRKNKNVYKILIRKPEGINPKCESFGIRSRIISKWILNKKGMMCSLHLAKQRVQ
jgi:hypothetical protein